MGNTLSREERRHVRDTNTRLATLIVENLKDTVLMEELTGMKTDYSTESGWAAPFHTNVALQKTMDSWPAPLRVEAGEISARIRRRAQQAKE